MRARLGSMPTAQNSSKLVHASARRRRLCSTLWMMSGLKTFSSKLPDAPPIVDRDVVAHHLRAHHRHRLALRRVHLAGHDRAARLVLGNRDLADAAARAGREPADVVGDLHQRGGQRLQRAVQLHERVVAAERRELVRRASRTAGPSARDLLRAAAGELRMRVEARADRRAAERQLVDGRQRARRSRPAR